MIFMLFLDHFNIKFTTCDEATAREDKKDMHMKKRKSSLTTLYTLFNTQGSMSSKNEEPHHHFIKCVQMTVMLPQYTSSALLRF